MDTTKVGFTVSHFDLGKEISKHRYKKCWQKGTSPIYFSPCKDSYFSQEKFLPHNKSSVKYPDTVYSNNRFKILSHDSDTGLNRDLKLDT